MEEGLSRREFLKVAGGAAASALVSEDSDASEHMSRIEKEDGNQERAIRDSLRKIHHYFLGNKYIDQTLDDGFAGETSSLEIKIEAATELLEDYEGRLSGLAERLLRGREETKSPTYDRVLENDLLQIRNAVAEVFALHNEFLKSQGISQEIDPFLETNPTFRELGLLRGDAISDFEQSERLGRELDIFKVTPIFKEVLASMEENTGYPLAQLIVTPQSFTFRNHAIQEAEEYIQTGERFTEWINENIERMVESVEEWEGYGMHNISQEQQGAAKHSLQAFVEYNKKIAHATHILAVPLKLHPNVGLPQDLIRRVKRVEALLAQGQSI